MYEHCFPGSSGGITRLELLKRGEDLNHELREAIEEWQPTREKTIPMLTDMADKIDQLCKNSTTENTEETAAATNKGAFGRFLENFKGLFTHHQSRGRSTADTIIAELNIKEAQKQMEEDHSATRKVLGLINKIEELVDQMTHLKTQAKKNEMLAILLDVDPEGIAQVARNGAELVIDIGEIGEDIADAGRKAIRFGETATKIGGFAALLGRKAGWIPGIGEAASEVGEAGEVAEKTGAVAIWVGELIEDVGEAVATVNAKIGDVVLKLGSSDLEVADVGIEMNLRPLDIEELVRNGLTVSHGESETKAVHDLREKATNYETQMKGILTAVREETPKD